MPFLHPPFTLLESKVQGNCNYKEKDYFSFKQENERKVLCNNENNTSPQSVTKSSSAHLIRSANPHSQKAIGNAIHFGTSIILIGKELLF